jgi:hypothetical protein
MGGKTTLVSNGDAAQQSGMGGVDMYAPQAVEYYIAIPVCLEGREHQTKKGLMSSLRPSGICLARCWACLGFASASFLPISPFCGREGLSYSVPSLYISGVHIACLVSWLCGIDCTSSISHL